MRERHWPFTTPESKRSFGDSIGRSDPRQAVDFHALAVLQELGRLEDYHAARVAWEQSRPRPLDFVPLDAALPLLGLEKRLAAEADEEFGRLWGSLLKLD